MTHDHSGFPHRKPTRPARDWRHRAASSALAALFFAGSAYAQAPTDPLLAPDKQAVVKTHVQKTKVTPATLDAPPAVGMIVPDSVELFGLPQDTLTEVPTVTSYRFFVFRNTIAVVEPSNRKVIQLIAQ